MIVYFAVSLMLFSFGIENFLFSILAFIILFLNAYHKKYKNCLIIICSFCLIYFLYFLYNKISLSNYGIVIKSKENYIILQTLFKRYYVYCEDNDFNFLDIILFKGNIGELSFNTLEGEFDFQKYLYNNMINKQLYFEKYELIFKNPFALNSYKTILTQQLNSEAKFLIDALIFNDIEYNSYKTLLDKYNIAFIFTISGIHIYLLHSLFYIITRNIFKDTAQYVSIILLIPFLILSTFKISILKSILIIINKEIINNKYTKIQILSFLLILTLISNPRYVYLSSFYYVFVMSYFISYLSNVFSNINKRYSKIGIPILLHIFFIPLNIYFNKRYNILSLIFSIISVFASQLILILALVSIVISPLKIIINILAKSFFDILDKFSNFGINLYYDNTFFIIFIFVLLIFLLIYAFEIKYMKIIKVIMLCMCSTLIIFSLPIDAYFSNYVVFINVGQGDCCLVHNKNKNILIDTGGSIYKDIATDVLIPYFNKKHIKKIDQIFISHNDYDHNGALETLISNFNVDEIIEGSNFYDKKVGDIIFKNLNTFNPGSEDNDNSSIIYFNFIDLTFLLMGDAGIEIENRLLDEYPNLTADIIKIGHHGSSTSTSDRLLYETKVKEAVISVGKNSYGHPESIVLEKLEKYGVTIRRTDIEGSIKYC